MKLPERIARSDFEQGSANILPETGPFSTAPLRMYDIAHVV